MTAETRTILAIIANALLFAAEAAAFRCDMRRHNNMKVSFRFFTIQSNCFAGIAALIMVAAEIVSLASGTPAARWALLVKYAATSSVTVTLMTVLLFLGPTQGYGRMLSGTSLWFHLLCPLLAIASFVLTDGGAPVEGKALIGEIPVILYGCLYYIRVVGQGRWEDFYGFNRTGKWYVSMLLMFLGGLVISFLLTCGHDILL